MSETDINKRFLLREIRRILRERPHISAKLLCDELGIPYKKYRSLIYNERWKMRKLASLRGTPSTPSVVYHAVTLRAVLPADVVGGVFERARGRVKQFGMWYPSGNRNGELAFVNRLCAAWIWPSGKFRMQFKELIGFDEAVGVARQVLLAAGLSEDVVAGLSFETEGHREFYIGKEVPTFKIKDYEEPLGLEIRADGSHPYSIETTEKWPIWAKELAKGVEKSITALQQSQMPTNILIKQLAEEVMYIAKLLRLLFPVEEMGEKGVPSYAL